MDGNYKSYSWTSSAKRITEILDQPAGQFEETDDLPSRDKLTYTNGFYGRCTALFIDIRSSSKLPTKHKRPTLAKIYRAFISEMVAALNSHPKIREVNIVGDCVWAVYNTPFRSDIDEVFSTAATANTLLKLLNARYQKRGIDPLKIGIGIDWGRALMIKAGYNGSGINDVIYMGDVVNRAAHLAHQAGRDQWGYSSDAIWVGDAAWSNMNEHNKGLLTRKYDNELGEVYTGNIVNTQMDAWVEENG
ncbi:adenylate/guanylate cyclase domain-containing protein [Aldersonia sp. NBC_00410]|uniref:adenylate/guanylate cyclase domain-containing protein n=1 Tax=Aldersonia sp. NBC_00410 TaxID=2975954 RepID=UPI00224CE8CE|nr:adenylate/guanylate cyclase domain-containing protein [Aldersonia sp. NBC_00410]MCX5046240.1 adenylate/guanylate cyclase domain-containing protein [Aldersonia sp. NBC_00410]